MGIVIIAPEGPGSLCSSGQGFVCSKKCLGSISKDTIGKSLCLGGYIPHDTCLQLVVVAVQSTAAGRCNKIIGPTAHIPLR